MADSENTIEETTDTEEAGSTEDAAAVPAAAAEQTATVEEEVGGEEPAAGEGSASEEAAAAETRDSAEEPSDAAEPAVEAAADAAAEAVAAAADAAPAEDGESAAPETAASGEHHTFDELKTKTVAQLRDIAEGLGDNDALHGYTTMHKEELLVALCNALGIEAHEHHEVVGIDKVAVKAKIRVLKQEREALIEARDAKQLKIVRRRIRSLKRKIRKATV